MGSGKGGRAGERAQVAPVTMGRVTYARAIWPAAWRAIDARARQESLIENYPLRITMFFNRILCALLCSSIPWHINHARPWYH